VNSARRFLAHLLFCCGVVLSAVPAHAATWHVWTNSPANGPGTDWSNAFHDIQSAVDVATSTGDVVLVTNGSYLLTGQLNITNPVTLRSVAGAPWTTIDGNGVTRCVYLSASNALIDGFRVTGGYAAGADGGGIYIDSGGTVQDCTVISNQATYRGGGIFCLSAGRVRDCRIVNNRTLSSSSGEGGGIHVWYSGLVDTCEISGNQSGEDGGGIQIQYGGVLQNSVVVSNVADAAFGSGGGVRLRYGGLAQNCRISQNSAGLGGGAWIRAGGIIRACVIVSNSAVYCGGGVGLNETGLVERCTVANNTANMRGGGISFGSSVDSSWPYYASAVRNCLIVSNHAAVGGGVLFFPAQVMRGAVENCTIYSNEATTVGGVASLASTNSQVTVTVIPQSVK